jgi:glutamate racemase
MAKQVTLKGSQPIGVFDSGIGGLTVAKAISKALPNENIIYFGDTEHMPYGDKSQQHILGYCDRIAEFLLSKKVKIIVIACNSASSVAYYHLKEKYKNRLDVISVITPVAKFVAEKKYKKVGIIGTKATIKTKAHEIKINSINNQIKVASVSTPLLAGMIEEGFYNNKISQTIINSYLKHTRLKGIDALVLACTHYPLIKKEVIAYYKKHIDVIDPSEIVAKSVEESLAADGLLNTNIKKKDLFYVSEYTESFEKSTKIFYNKGVKIIEIDMWN